VFYNDDGARLDNSPVRAIMNRRHEVDIILIKGKDNKRINLRIKSVYGFIAVLAGGYNI
jgi:hypothetical protein